MTMPNTEADQAPSANPGTVLSRPEAFDHLLCVAVHAVDALEHIADSLHPAGDAAGPLIDHLKACIAAETLAVMERWPA